LKPNLNLTSNRKIGVPILPLGQPSLAEGVHLRLAIEGKYMFTYGIGYAISKYLYIHL